MKNYLDP